jgi:iron complex outermembrane recepter protein
LSLGKKGAHCAPFFLPAFYDPLSGPTPERGILNPATNIWPTQKVLLANWPDQFILRLVPIDNRIKIMRHLNPLIAVLTLAVSPFALAQPASAQGASGSSLLMEEIIVTARKREQSLQDVSVSVAALPESLLTDALITDSEDLTQLVPSLNIQKSGAPRGSSFNIRGVGTQSFSSAVEPSVSTVLDGVVLGRSGMAFFQLLDVQRVEVLRGPQGTLFGKNSTAGVVHIITQDPTDEFTGAVNTRVINDDQVEGGFTVSGPVSDTVGYRLTGSYAWDDGYIDNAYTGNKLNSKDTWSLRGKLRFDPADTLSLLWSSDYSDQDGDCCVGTYRSLEPFPAEPPNNQDDVDGYLSILSPVVPGEENTDANHNYPDELEVTGFGHSLTADWDIGDHTLTSISALREWEQETSADADMLPERAAIVDVWQGGHTEQEQWTQELRLTSSADQLISYVVGLYYFDQTINRTFDRFIGADIPQDGVATSDFQVDTLNYAAFGEATWNITDDFRMVAGARYTNDEIEFDFMRDGNSGFQPNIDPFGKKVNEDDTSGKGTLEWNATDDVLLYASYVEGYKGPAYNVTTGSSPDNTQPVDPETSESFEVGMKSNWFDNRLVLNVSIFSTEYSDFQAQATESVLILDDDGNTQDLNMDGTPDRRFSFLLTNVGEVTTEGIEIDLMAQPTENLSLFGGVAWIDAEIDSYEGGPCSPGQEFRDSGYRGQTSCGDDDPLQDLSGGELPYSPDWKLTLAANYFVAVEEMPFDVILNANFRAQDDVQLSIDQDVYQRQDSYEILDLSLRLQDKDDRYTATLFVKNVFDEFYVSNIAAQNENLLPNAYFHFLPRTHERRIGVEFRYNWF